MAHVCWAGCCLYVHRLSSVDKDVTMVLQLKPYSARRKLHLKVRLVADSGLPPLPWTIELQQVQCSLVQIGTVDNSFTT